MLKAVLLLFAVCSALAALDSNTGESKPAASVGPAGQFMNNTTTATTPSMTAATNATTPTTTPAATNATTPTTTPAATNATTPTTTPAATNTTTTAATNTTTTATTTTTIPATTPSTNETVGNYSLKTDKGICLKAVMGLKIRLESKEANGTFTVQPSQTSAKGGCEKTTANLTLVFTQGFITFMFNKSVADNVVYVDTLSFQLSYPFTNGGFQPYKGSNSSLQLFSARIGHAYSCRQESVYMGNGLYLDVIQDRMQAFNLTSNDFGTSDPCPADKPDYRVAIAVGVTLLVLIVVVVVVYLLGRRKRSDGYQSL